MDCDVLENTNIAVLPEEVLVKIFLQLPLSDVKQVRQVSKQWYNVSNRVEILRREKLVVSSAYNITEIRDVLENCMLRFMNLEFHGIYFNEQSVSLWIKCGSRISSLDFFDCWFTDENIENIFQSCENLNHLGWHDTVNSLKPAGYLLYSDEVLQKLVKNKIIRDKLTSLSFNLIDVSCISSLTLPLTLSVFPQAREFEFFVEKTNVNFHVEAEKDWNTITSFSILDNLISMDVITKVKLVLPSLNNQIYRGFACCTNEPILDFVRCTPITPDVNLNTCHWEAMIDFCTRRKHLETVICFLETEPEEDSTNKELFAHRFLLTILRGCPQLRHLVLKIMPSWNPVDLSYDLFEAMLISGLKSLSIYCDGFKLDPLLNSSITAKRLPVNVTMRSLTLEAGFMQHLLFIEHFKGLQFLEIYNANHHGLQAIWEHQTELLCLKLMFISPFTASFTGKIGYSDEQFIEEEGLQENTRFCIDRLKNLQFLTISAIQPDWNAADDIFDYFTFPKLRYLQLEIMDDSGVTGSVLRMIKRLPQLEAVLLKYYNEMSFCSWSDLCTNMKQLRFLKIVGSDVVEEPCTDSEYKHLFSICSTLRGVLHGHKEGRDRYYYNTVKKAVMKNPSEYAFRKAEKLEALTIATDIEI